MLDSNSTASIIPLNNALIKRQIVRVDQNTGPNYRFSIRNPQTHIDGKQRDGERYTMLTLIERKWE